MKRLLKICLLTFFVAIGVQMAIAQTGPTNAPMREWIDTGNTANRLLCATIGDVGGTGLFGRCDSDATAMLHKVLKVFNIAVFSLAALFVLWNILSGVMTSANDGEFLGRKTSSTWAPLRMVIGGAMIVPAFGGFSLAQLVMVWATAVGVGIAGAAVSSSGAALHPFLKPYSAPTALPDGRDLVGMLSLKSGCIADWVAQTKKWEATAGDSDAAALRWGITPSVRTVNGGDVLLLEYGALSTQGGYSSNECGTVRIPLPNPEAETDPGVRAILQAVSTSVQTQSINLANVIWAEYEALALEDPEMITTERKAAILNRVGAAIEAYESAVRTAADGAVANANTQSARATVGTGDWVGFGFAFVKTAQSSIAVSKGSQGAPESSSAARTAPDTGGEKGFWSSTGEALLQGALNTSPAYHAYRAIKNREQIAETVSAVSTDGVWQTLNSAIANEVNQLGKVVGSKLSGTFENGNVMKSLIQLGADLSGWGLVIITGFVLAALVVSVIPAVGIGGVISFVGMLILVIVVPLTFFGLKLAAYLPFLVAVIWAAAMLNWLVIVIESLFGAPLWAMVHMDMDGDGLNMQRTGHGYIFILNLFFRPIMMVGALLFAVNAVEAIFGLFLGAVSGALGTMTANANNWWQQMIMIIGALWVVVMFAEQIITSAFGLIFQIPDKVFQWIGGHFGSTVGADIEHGVAQGAGGSIQRRGEAVGQGVVQSHAMPASRSPKNQGAADGGSGSGGNVVTRGEKGEKGEKGDSSSPVPTQPSK